MYDDRNCVQTQKKKTGRPPLGPLAKHGLFAIRVHEDELILWRQMAQAEGKTLTDFVLDPLRKSLVRRKAK